MFFNFADENNRKRSALPDSLFRMTMLEVYKVHMVETLFDCSYFQITKVAEFFKYHSFFCKISEGLSNYRLNITSLCKGMDQGDTYYRPIGRVIDVSDWGRDFRNPSIASLRKCPI